jgi:hypothetical protein
MAEIATWSAILNKTGLGKTSNECPTKAELLALNNGKDSNVDKVIVISNAASYGNNECVKLEDINAEQWIYTFQWDPNGNPSFNAPATGGTYPFGSYASNRVKQVNGVNTSISQSLKDDVIKTSEGSWYTTDYDGNKGRIVPNNTSTNSKSITVTWTQKYSGKTLQATFTQAAGRKVYSSWNYNCRVDKTSFSYSGGQSNVTAKSASRTYTWNGQGSSYTESETATVRVSSPASISGNSISIPSNSGSARNFTVTFDFPTATDQTISISQEGGQVSYVDHLSIDPTTKNVSGSGQTFDVIVNANYDEYLNGIWQENIKSQYTNATVVSGSSSDITITRTSTGCSIKVAPNPNESSSRTYVVEFEYASATPVRLNITQYPAEVSYPSGGYYLGQSRVSNSGFTTSNLQVTRGDNKGGSFTVYYKSYRTKYVNGSSAAGIEPVTPNISPKDLWVNTYIDPRPNSDNVYTVEVRYQANLNHSNRSTRITGSNGSAYDVYVDFTQDPADSYEFQIRKTTSDSWSTSITYDNWPGNDGVMNGPFIINSLKNGERFTNWWASSNVDWITIQDDGSTVRYIVATNNGSSSRTGVITFTQGESGKTCTLTVIQNAGISYRFSFNELGDQTESALSVDFSLQTISIQVYSNNSQGKPVQFALYSGMAPSWAYPNILTTNAIPEEVGVEFDENPTHSNRSGTITLIQPKSGKTLTLKVSQAGRFYNLELLGSGVVYLWDDVIKPTNALSPNTKYATRCPTLLKHQGSLTVNNSALGSLGSQVGNKDRINIYRYDGTWRFVTSFILIQGDQAISW